MKTFKEVFESIQASVKLSPNGIPKKVFSRVEFDKLALAFLNERGYKIDGIKAKADSYITKEYFPVQEFRNMIKDILVHAGLDAPEAKKIMEDYDFTNASCMYEICSELIYKYIQAGRKFTFIPREDFQGSLIMDEKPETVVPKKYFNKADEGNCEDRKNEKVKIEKHYVIKSKSKTPKWKKHDFR